MTEAPTLDTQLDDPAVSHALKAVILIWRSRDPVEAASDAAVLAAVLGNRAAMLLDRRYAG